MRTIHNFRKSRFLFLRSRYAYFQPRSTFSFAAFQSLLRAPNAPRAAFITCFLRFKRTTFDLTRGIVCLLYACRRRLMFFASPRTVIVVDRRSRRFRLEVFFVRMWLLNALKRLTLPVPVSLKRFLAPRWLFIFGISDLYSLATSSLALFGRENHRHELSLELRFRLDLRDVSELLRNPIHYDASELRVRDLPPAKHQRHLHLVPIRQKFAGVSRLRGEIVLFNSRTKLHFLEMDHMLLLLCLPRHLRLLELELSVVHYANYRGTSERCDFDEIQPLVYRGGQC